MAGKGKPRVKFRPKSPGQKRDCIAPGCDNESTREACAERGGIAIQIRCCDSKSCQAFAAEQVRSAVLYIEQSPLVQK